MNQAIKNMKVNTARAGLPLLGEMLEAVYDRGNTSATILELVTSDTDYCSALWDAHVGPALDKLEDHMGGRKRRIA